MESFRALNNGMSIIVENGDIRMIGYTKGNRVDITFNADDTRSIYVDYKHIAKFSEQLVMHSNFEGICEMYAKMGELYYDKYVGRNV